MDIFKFTNPTAKTKMEQGTIINGLKSKLWIERYREAGEFELVSPAELNIRKQLSIGSFISHTKTQEIMVVENHEISDDKGKESELVITGRSLEVILENRIVNANRTYPYTNVNGITPDFFVGNTTCAGGAVYLGSYHTQTTYLINDDDALLWIIFMQIGAAGGTIATRIAKRGTLYQRFIELCDIDNLGVKITRPGSWSPQSPSTVIGVHKGLDKSKQVVRSYDTGEIDSIDYLWSNKRLKNAALVSGKWVEVMVNNPALKEYDRRIMTVDGTDIDESYTAVPTGTNLTNVISAMTQRGTEVLSYLNDVAITKAQVAKTAARYEYRKDYNVGDLITVTGDYNEKSIMRVSEYVEIEDENGESGYPTLTLE